MIFNLLLNKLLLQPTSIQVKVQAICWCLAPMFFIIWIQSGTAGNGEAKLRKCLKTKQLVTFLNPHVDVSFLRLLHLSTTQTECFLSQREESHGKAGNIMPYCTGTLEQSGLRRPQLVCICQVICSQVWRRGISYTTQDGRNFPFILLIFTTDWWPYVSLFYIFVLQMRRTVFELKYPSS